MPLIWRRKIKYYIWAIAVLFTINGSMNCYGQFLQLKFDHITSEKGLPHSTIHGIAKDKYGFMWFGTWSGLCRYDGYTVRVYRYDPENPRSVINNRIHNVMLDSIGDLWISTFNGEYYCKYNYDTDDFDRIPNEKLPSQLSGKINRREHKLQVNYSYRHYRWHLAEHTTALVETYLPTGKQKVYAVDPSIPWTINDAYVSDLFLDDDHVLWLGTYSNGINRSYLEATPFHVLYHDPNKPNSIIENTVKSICEDKQGNLWIGTRSKGITLIAKDGSYRHFQNNPQIQSSIQSNYIKKLFCDSKGLIWIGNQRGLDRYDPETGVLQAMEHPELSNIAVFGMAEDHKTNIWLATWNGLFKYDRKQDRLSHFEVEKTLPHAHVWTVFIDSKQQIWVGTEGGGIAILKEEPNGRLSSIKQLQHDGTTNQSISDNRIYSILEDSNHRFWIGTGNGLDYYDWQTDSIKHLSQQSELWPKGTIAGITEDSKGFIWVSHKQGLSRIEKKSLAIRTFSKQDGLQSNEFMEGAVHRSKGNLLYFGGNAGVNYFSPDSIRTNLTVPKVVFTELRILNQAVEVNQKINGRVVLDRPLYLTSALDLTHDDKSISIEFAALHYANPQGNKYAHKLEGFDKDWIYTDASKRVASYSNLVPGKYTFKVKASNSDGIWTDTPIQLDIHVAPAIWASQSAYVLYGIIILALLYAFFYYITRYTRIKSKMAYEAILHKKERELHENKVQFFTNISHEIKTPLSLILSPIQQLKEKRKNDDYLQKQLKTMENNGNRLLKTVHQLLDIRRFETGHETLRTDKIDIIILAQKVIDSFSQEARYKKIQLKIDSKIPSLFVEVDPDKIEKILYNLLSNAFKFTARNGIIKIRIRQTESQVLIDVIDNGSGISATDLDKIFTPFLQGKTSVPGGSGLGLTYSRSLVEMHGGTLSVQSRTHSNRFTLTIFTIHLPLNDGAQQLPAEINQSSNTGLQPKNDLSPSPSDPNTIDYLLPRRCTLLLVEDNDEMRRYLSDFFAPDYDVLHAENGEEGLLLAQEHVPDLIISDVMMPKTDGISFVRLIKANTLLRHIPVILLTARSLVEYELEGLEMGADDYMVKPFHLPVLALKVRNQLLSRFQMQEKFKQKISIEPTKLDVQSPDEQLLQRVLTYVEENIADSDLKVDSICSSIGLSRAQLYRKVKALTGFTMADLIKEMRLKRAGQLLRDNSFQVSEVAYMVGFSDPYYFSKNFKARFGYSPSEYAKADASDHPN